MPSRIGQFSTRNAFCLDLGTSDLIGVHTVDCERSRVARLSLSVLSPNGFVRKAAPVVGSKVQAKCLAGYSVSVWRAWQVFGGRLRECVQVFRECLALGLNRGQNLIIKTHTCEAAGGGKWGGGF